MVLKRSMINDVTVTWSSSRDVGNLNFRAKVVTTSDELEFIDVETPFLF